jgi:hypothetical protein
MTQRTGGDKGHFLSTDLSAELQKIRGVAVKPPVFRRDAR